MGSLSRFLDRDAAAKAVLLAVLGSAPIPAAAEAIKPAKAPPAAKPAHAAGPADIVSEERILVALMGERTKLGKVVGLLRESTERCLSGQFRLLDAAAGSTPGSGGAAIGRAVELRARDIADEMEGGTATEEMGAILRSGHLLPDERDALIRHASLRQACLDWSERSMGFLRDRLADPKAGDASALIAEARAASGRDLGRLARMGPLEGGKAYDEIEAMETGAAPRM